MKSLVGLLLVSCVGTALSLAVDDAQEAKRGVGQCWTSEGIFNHGDWVSPRRSPCLKYRCNAGKLRFEKAGCPWEGKCYDAGQVWSGQDCHTYRCQAMSYNSYQIVRLRSGCKDAYGRCRRPGEVFPYPVEGRIFPSCTCSATPYRIRYRCAPQYGRGHGRVQ